jgi:mRNA-degrading endonuclease toxin of MazEF toxin-antitoxin module
VINVTQLVGVDRRAIDRRVGSLPADRLRALDASLRLILRLILRL